MKMAYDLAHVKGVSVFVLLHPDRPGELAGKVVCNHSDNPAGSVCTATVSVWAGPLSGMEKATGRAGGYGYCKTSAATSAACASGLANGAKDGSYTSPEQRAELARILAEDPPRFNGSGMSNHEGAGGGWFSRLGYTLLEVV